MSTPPRRLAASFSDEIVFVSAKRTAFGTFGGALLGIAGELRKCGKPIVDLGQQRFVFDFCQFVQCVAHYLPPQPQEFFRLDPRLFPIAIAIQGCKNGVGIMSPLFGVAVGVNNCAAV